MRTTLNYLFIEVSPVLKATATTVSKYFSELSSINQERYLEKLKFINNKDPYSLPANEFQNDFENIPQLSQGEVMEYLLFRASPFTQQEIRAHKSVAAFAQIVCSWVKDLKTIKILENYLFLGKVLHSERLNEPPLKPWFILSAQGKVLAAHCDCRAGLVEICTPVAAILYTLLERIPHKSVTDRLAYWIAPKRTNIHLAVEEIDFSTPRSLWQTSSKTQDLQVEVGQKKTKAEFSRAEAVTFLEKYRKLGCTSALHKILKPFTSGTATSTGASSSGTAFKQTESHDELSSANAVPLTHETIQKSLKLIFINFKYSNIPPIPELDPEMQEFFNKKIVVSIETAVDIAVSTMGQNNILWKLARHCRTTASRCYELYTYCNNKNPNWDKKIDAYLNPPFSGNIYTQYGTNQESAARTRYEKQFRKVHQTGVIINPALPWLACSPDGIKMLQGQFYWLIEIKCPMAGATKTINEFIRYLPFVKYDENKLFPYFLNPTHMYYGQVQLSMTLLNLQFCDFVIYSSFDDEILVLEVHRDEPFIESLIQKLHHVYFNYILRKLYIKGE